MRLPMICSNLSVSVIAFTLLMLLAPSVQAVTVNFSSTLYVGTCSFALDKTVLPFGTIPSAQFISNSLLSPQPFNLMVRGCTAGSAHLMPVANVSGEGFEQNGKWLFRSSDSTVDNIGVMLVKTDTLPSYGDVELRHGDDIPLASTGETPLDQNITLYAGLTCGSSCSASLSGQLNARIIFSLEYR